MAKILYINANPKPVEHSFGLRAGEKFLEVLKANKLEIEELPLFKMEIPEIDQEVLAAWDKMRTGAALTENEKRKTDRINQFTEQFIAAD